VDEGERPGGLQLQSQAKDPPLLGSEGKEKILGKF
jgi:hypothetical protein